MMPSSLKDKIVNWIETFYEVTTSVHDILSNPQNAEKNYPGLVQGIETHGSIWLRSTCISIADEFEKEYPEQEWFDLDYLDTVYEFTLEKLSEL